MRIQGPNGTNAAAGARSARRSGTGEAVFTLGEGQESRPATSTGAANSVGGIDALLALQGVEDPRERRKRAVKQGFRALDVLDELKLKLLSGGLDQATLLRLKAAAAGLKDGSGDPGLDSVLAEIDLRVEVELAKAGIS